MKIRRSRLEQIIKEEIERFKVINETLQASQDLQGAMLDLRHLDATRKETGPEADERSVKNYGSTPDSYKSIMRKLLAKIAPEDLDGLETATNDIEARSLEEIEIEA
jgi:tRNA isopentenyl-2-thiomethyl-A-37 hydroxylase MiaE